MDNLKKRLAKSEQVLASRLYGTETRKGQGKGIYCQ